MLASTNDISLHGYAGNQSNDYPDHFFHNFGKINHSPQEIDLIHWNAGRTIRIWMTGSHMNRKNNYPFGPRVLFGCTSGFWRPVAEKNHALFSRYFALRYRYERLLGVILALFSVIFIFRILWIFGVPTLPSPWHRWLTTPFEQPWISMKSGSAVPTAAKSRPSPYESWQ